MMLVSKKFNVSLTYKKLNILSTYNIPGCRKVAEVRRRSGVQYRALMMVVSKKLNVPGTYKGWWM